MNILHLSRTMGQGGAEKVVFQLAIAGKKSGYHVCVVSSGGHYVKQLQKEGITHYQVCDLECKSPVVMLQTLRTLEKVIRKEHIEILHTHHRMAALYGQILKICFPKLKLVYTAHNVFYNKKFLTSISLANSYIVAVGEGVKNNLIEFFGIKSECIQVIYNAVKIDGKYEVKEPVLEKWKEDDFFLIGMIGRLSKQKGVDVFVHTFERLKSKNIKIKGVIIGDGELRTSLEDMISEHGLQNDIWLMGYQEHIISLISQLDLVVMPSRWEGFPLLPIEVFSAGKTLVASDVNGINEIIKQNQTGILVPMDNVDVFTSKIMKLIQHPELKKQLEENGQMYYKEHFSYQSFIKQYQALYHSILSERGIYENIDDYAR